MRISDWSSDVCSSDLGGQTALNTALALADDGTLETYGVELIGAKREAIRKAEDRLLFRDAMNAIGIETPKSAVVNSMDDAWASLDLIGLPAIIRPRSEEHTSELQSILRNSHAVFCLKTKHT